MDDAESLPLLKDLIRAHREAAIDRQEDLAQKVGVGSNTVARWERGESVPSVRNLSAIVEAYGLNEQQRDLLLKARNRAKGISDKTKDIAILPDDLRNPHVVEVASESEGQLGRRSPRRVQALMIMAAVVVVAIGAWLLTQNLLAGRSNDVGARTQPRATPSDSQSVPNPDLGRATLSSPSDGSQVPSSIEASGTASLKPGTALWLLLKPVNSDTYFFTTKKPITVPKDGVWASHLTAGTGRVDQGEEFDLFVLLSPRGGVVDATTPQPSGYRHFSAIPADSEVTDTLHFTMVQWTGS